MEFNFYFVFKHNCLYDNFKTRFIFSVLVVQLLSNVSRDKPRTDMFYSILPIICCALRLFMINHKCPSCYDRATDLDVV